MNSKFLINIWWILLIGLFSTAVFGQTKMTTANVENQPKTETQLLGKWQTKGEILEFFKDGIVTLNCIKVKYSVVGDTIILEFEVVESAKLAEDDINIIKYPFILNDDTLTLLTKGEKITYTKLPNDTNQAETHVWSGGSNPSDFIGQWCLKSVSENATYCLRFYKNGSYEEFEKIISADDGSSTRYRTAGRWSVKENYLTTCEDNGKKEITSSFEKRKHPQTGAPMLIINSKNYVMTDQKRRFW